MNGNFKIFKENKLKNISHYEESLKGNKIEFRMLEDMLRDLKEMYSVIENKTLLDKKTQKITSEDVRAIKKLRSQGMSIRDIKKEINWSTATISKAINGFYDNECEDKYKIR